MQNGIRGVDNASLCQWATRVINRVAITSVTSVSSTVPSCSSNLVMVRALVASDDNDGLWTAPKKATKVTQA
ncbi:hypothetical protein ZHAS_00002544 [Anopheles sinensis]|uniref:Uncharacterized protein n=1 Tax=Anopheles sinensis TaxID=74873 RepID=A0A084VCG6_ANOSI|nr:hypothetical protein ZHAS_00002544 [Anopheles sinensis]